MTAECNPLMQVENLHISFKTPDGLVPAVTGVSFAISPGESVALVGESGSGKSVTALSCLRLLPMPPAEVKADVMSFNGIDLLSGVSGIQKVRGNEVAMIFQEPMTSLNPLLTIGFQIAEAAAHHLGYSRKKAWAHAVEMLELAGIPDAAKRAKTYPHQMSGGMRQRVMIAIALVCSPKLLIADEPTTALDVTIQAQILKLTDDLQKKNGMALLLITHNMGIVAQKTERVMVMYAGQIVESTATDNIFTQPAHPYTDGLLRSIPSAAKKVKRLNVIPGAVPSPMFYPKGCRFAPRCSFAKEKCAAEQPELREISSNHLVRCHYPKV